MKTKLKGPRVGTFLKNGLLICVIAAGLSAIFYGVDYLTANYILPVILGL